MSEPTLAIVLAAGKGTRMESDLPKVLVPACGRPMIEFVIDALHRAGIEHIVIVIGYRAELVRTSLAHRKGISFVEQTEQLGTGHAVMMCRDDLLKHQGSVLVVTGDSPLIQSDSIRQLLDLYQQARPACILGTLIKDDPHGLGRIVRDGDGNFVGIVEDKDASEEQRRIREVNMSTYVFDGRLLPETLDRLTNDNRQQEYYLTDCPGILHRQGRDVRALPVLKPCEALSVNTMQELAFVEREMRRLGIAH